MTQENTRLQEAREGTSHWKKWGPYLASGSGARFARTTARMEMPGTTSP